MDLTKSGTLTGAHVSLLPRKATESAMQLRRLTEMVEVEAGGVMSYFVQLHAYLAKWKLKH